MQQPAHGAAMADDEIDLRAYVEVLWRSRWVIAAVTLGAAVLAFLVSRFGLARVYEAGALLVAESPPARAQTVVGERPDRLAELVEAAARPSWLSAESYRELAAGEAFRQQLAARLGQEAPVSQDSWRLRPEVVRGSNLLRLTVEASDPALAARVSNLAAQQLLDQVNALNQERLARVVAFLEQQLVDARQALEKANQDLQAFSRREGSVEELQQELDAKLTLLTQYKSRAVELEVARRRGEATLASLEQALAGEPATVTVKKGLAPEAAVLEQVSRSIGVRTEGPLVVMDDQQLNPVRVELETEAARLRSELSGMAAEQERLARQVEELSGQVKALQARLVEGRARRDELVFRADMARRNYEVLMGQYQAQKAVAAARVGEAILTLAAPAVAPRAPVRPNVLLNTAVAGMLGMMASVFGVFFAELLRRPAVTVQDAAQPAAGAVPTAAR